MHATICDCFADTVQNAIEAGASRIEASLAENGVTVKVVIKDNGKGMDDDMLKRVWDPFYSEAGKHDKRRVGLGLPLLRQMVEAAGGSLSLESKRGLGTCLSYSFDAKHFDTPPLGDLPGTLLTLMNYDGNFELCFSRERADKSYTICRSELQEALGDLCDASNLVLARSFLRDLESDL